MNPGCFALVYAGMRREEMELLTITVNTYGWIHLDSYSAGEIIQLLLNWKRHLTFGFEKMAKN